VALSPPPFRRHQGTVAALPRVNVDTDQIVPKQFLKRTERTGFGQFLFHDWRFRPDGSPDPSFELNHAGAQGASILLAGPNFGCGSSREHAVWALAEYGFRAVIAESFADIFYANACQNGMLPVHLSAAQMGELFQRYESESARGKYHLTVDLEAGIVTDAAGFHAAFALDPYRREMLLRGLDEIGRTLMEEERIAEFERSQSKEWAQ
jgi:3-isopropylmalate/(R)-2-methylmalate dehydratase small subunit